MTYPVDNFGTVVGENPTPYGNLALWAVNGLSIVYWVAYILVVCGITILPLILITNIPLFTAYVLTSSDMSIELYDFLSYKMSKLDYTKISNVPQIMEIIFYIFAVKLYGYLQLSNEYVFCS